MIFRMAGIEMDSIVDGEGMRLTVFFQGCPHHCTGCHNPETHDFSGGDLGDTDEILSLLTGSYLMEGITLSGGEPFCQSEAFRVLAEGAHRLGKTVWVYTGYTYEQLLADEEKAALLGLCDVLVDGRFNEKQRSLALLFRGSANQRLIDVQRSLAKGEVVWWKDPWRTI